MLFRPMLVAAVAFVATNIDDLFLLVGFFSDLTIKTRQVIAGQYLGSGVLVVASLLCSLLALVIPKGYIRILGLLPLFIGLKDLSRSYSDDDEIPRSGRNLLEVTAVTVSCGADNIAVYVPLFAGGTAAQVGITIAVFEVMVGVWCAGRTGSKPREDRKHN
jgi:cadmium resistance protein CadD (predicted permease)